MIASPEEEKSGQDQSSSEGSWQRAYIDSIGEQLTPHLIRLKNGKKKHNINGYDKFKEIRIMVHCLDEQRKELVSGKTAKNDPEP